MIEKKLITVKHHLIRKNYLITHLKKNQIYLWKNLTGFNKLKFRSFLSFFTLIFLIFGVGFGGWFVMKEIQQVNIVEEDIFPIIIDNDINKQDKLATRFR